MNRVVITGLGAVTPIGNNVEDFWQNSKNGNSGIDFIKSMDTSDLEVKVGGEVKDLKLEKNTKQDDVYTLIIKANKTIEKKQSIKIQIVSQQIDK